MGYEKWFADGFVISNFIIWRTAQPRVLYDEYFLMSICTAYIYMYIYTDMVSYGMSVSEGTRRATRCRMKT